MKPETTTYLNKINRDFYKAVADDFDESRGSAWPGWERLTPYLKAPITVLDVGCGNGRFALFLHEQAGIPNIQYHGIDSNEGLLTHANKALEGKSGLEFTLEQRDIVERPPETGDYDLVVLLGVLHHIPGSQQRMTFMRQLADRVKPGGLLVFTAWRFYEYERFRDRVVPWPADVEVEEHDYLLDWRRGTFGLRYCHYTDDKEHDAIVAVTGLQEIETYRADGPGGTANRYSILQRR